jgi:nucleotide-binding universal stress UspA family protein
VSLCTEGGFVPAAVNPGQPESVVRHAAALALSFGSELMCAYVDVNCYTQRNSRDGVERFFPIDSDAGTGFDQRTLDRVRDELQRNLSRTHVSWSLRGLAGDPARELSLLADRVDVSIIVVSTRRPGLGRRLGELLEGSVASASRSHES